VESLSELMVKEVELSPFKLFEVSDRLLPQWLTGVIALSCFLFLTFVGVLVKKAWCGESKNWIEIEYFIERMCFIIWFQPVSVRLVKSLETKKKKKKDSSSSALMKHSSKHNLML
uniref:Uncharacterized protein n=1 Tax=Scophthalmus maximus TaxID=52904 RepID=A0A8D3DIE1_SCOMX